MSSTALIWVKNMMPRKVDGTPDSLAKFVLWVLCDMHNDTNGLSYVWPSQQKLATITGLGRSTVNDRLRALELQGYISRSHSIYEEGARRGQRAHDHITLRLDRPHESLAAQRQQPGSLKLARATEARADRSRRRREAQENFVAESMASDHDAEPSWKTTPLAEWTCHQMAEYIGSWMAQRKIAFDVDAWAAAIGTYRGEALADPRFEMRLMTAYSSTEQHRVDLETRSSDMPEILLEVLVAGWLEGWRDWATTDGSGDWRQHHDYGYVTYPNGERASTPAEVVALKHPRVRDRVVQAYRSGVQRTERAKEGSPHTTQLLPSSGDLPSELEAG